MMNKLAKLMLLTLLVSAVLSGCNTFHGFGQDVSTLGGAISRAAE